MGVRWGLQVAVDQGLPSFTIASDAATVVNCIHRKIVLAAIEPVIQDCRDLMSTFANICIKHVRRSNNSEAHNIASLATNDGSRSWMGNGPTLQSYCLDVNSLHSCVPAFP